MIFKKQSLALLLACISSTAAFAPTAFNRAIATAPSALARTSTSVPKRFVTLNADVDEGSADAVIEPDTEAEDVVESESAEVEVVAEEAEAETVAEPVEEKKKERPEEDITRVAYVVNLSYDTEFFTIKELFSQFGAVTKVFVPKDRNTGKNKGIAFVTMGTEAERDAAIEGMNQQTVDNRKIFVDKAKPRGEGNRERKEMTKLYVGNISYETTPEQLEERFSEFGPVSNIYVPMDKYSGEPRGFAFLALAPADAEKAIAACDGTELDGRTIEVKVSLPRGSKAPNRKNETKLYIGNISFDTEQETLRELFEDYGPIVDLYCPLDANTGRPRGFAFVTLEPENAIRAIEEVDGWEVDGRMLRVNEAQPKGSSGGGFNDDQATNEW